MVKSKKKKEKTADFKKVKFKVGKHKLRGSNVTDTSFKTATINISAQLETFNGPTNKRNLSLKELLTQINHYSATVRHEALLGILDLFQSHPNVMHGQLNLWISKVMERLSDTDSVVRHSLFLCIRYTMNVLEEKEILPFFKIMIAHICCGMTHINEGVQLDSLNVLDILLTKFPEAFIPFWKKVLTNFMDLISKQSSKQTSASQSVRGTKVKTKGREINTVVNGKISSVKGREQILEKLHKILKVMLTYQQTLLKTHKLDSKTESVYVSENGWTNVRVCKYTIEIPEICDIEFEGWLDKDNGTGTKDFDNIYHLAAIVLPVLINCWVEYDPGQLASGFVDSSSLSSLLPGMKATINTLDALMKLLWSNSRENDREEFIKDNINTFKDFYVHFVQLFFLPMHNSNVQASFNTLQEFSVDFNFIIARILCNILQSSHCALDAKQQEKCINKMGLFITDALQLKSFGNDSVSQLIILIENVFLLNEKQRKVINHNNENKAFNIPVMMKELAHIFARVSVDSPWKVALVKFFSKLILNEKDGHFLEKNQCDHIMTFFIDSLVSNMWMLPSFYCELVQQSVKFVKDLLVIGVVTDKTNVAILDTLIKLTELNGGLFLQVSLQTQMTIVEVVYNLSLVPLNLLQNLSLICHANTVSVPLKKYIVSVISLCLKKRFPSIKTEEFISFIMSVVVGYSFSQLQKINVCNPIRWNTFNLLVDDPKEPMWDFVIDQLKQIHGYENLWSILLLPIEKLLLSLQSIPLNAAHGLIKLLLKLSLWRIESPQFVINQTEQDSVNVQVADLVSTVLLYLVSDTFKSEVMATNKSYIDHQFLYDSISLLGNDKSLCCHIIKKWILIIEDNKTNLTCVKSIVEVILALLDEPMLRNMMRDIKPCLASICLSQEIHSLSKPTALLQLLAIQVSLL